MLSSTSIAEHLLQTRLQQSVDVSATFDNCFFHSYAAYLLDLFRNSTAVENCLVDTVLESSCTSVYTPVLRSASPRTSLTAASFERGLLESDLPLPDNLFTFESILGDESNAKELQTVFPNKASLNLFEAYSTLRNPGTRPLSPHFIVEKTLVLGVLLREWFATQLAKNIQHRDAQYPDIITRFTSYKSFRTSLSKDELLPESNIYLSSEAFLEYYVARPKKRLTDNEIHFEQYFQIGSEENALIAYWQAEGYDRYCKYLARLNVKLAPSDFVPVLESLGQPLTIYNTDGSIKNSLPGEPARPPLEVVLMPIDGHYRLLKTPTSDGTLLKEYKRSQDQYKKDREAIQGAMGNTNKLAIANSKPSLLVGATCLSQHVPWKPSSSLLNKLRQMQQFVMENTNSEYFNRAQKNFMRQIGALKIKCHEFQDRSIHKGDNYDKANKAARRLYNGLKEAGGIYFQNPSKDSYEQFKEDCNTILKKERGVLETHRRWRNVVYANIGIAIACLVFGLVVGYPLVLLANKRKTGNFFFSTTTDSATKIDAIEESIKLSEPKTPH